MTLVDLTVQNQTRWPCPIISVQKTGGSDEFNFEPLQVGEKLKFEETSQLNIPVQMPDLPGEYSLKLGFFNHKGMTGEDMTFKFTVSDSSI
jgi:hypothetical protein